MSDDDLNSYFNQRNIVQRTEVDIRSDSMR
jgi:hypothetical protein